MNVAPNTMNFWGVLYSLEFQIILAVHKTMHLQTKPRAQIARGRGYRKTDDLWVDFQG